MKIVTLRLGSRDAWTHTLSSRWTRSAGRTHQIWFAGAAVPDSHASAL